MKSYQSTNKQEKLSLEECLELGRRCASGDAEAREQLIVSHMYLVNNVMFSFVDRGVSRDDLFQEGCYGLLKAVKMYDYKRGFHFSTYAVHWIRKQMRTALRDQNIDRPIVLKDHEYWQLVKVCACVNDWTQKHGYQPSCEELANELHFSVEQTEKLLKISEPFINIEDCSFRKEEQLRSAEDVFFDKFIFLDDAGLTDREKAILACHLGLMETSGGFTEFDKGDSLKEIAASLHLSYETIRLDYRSALHKIKTKFLDSGAIE